MTAKNECIYGYGYKQKTMMVMVMGWDGTVDNNQ